MAKTSRTKPRSKRTTDPAARATVDLDPDVPVVGPREPCPCGSGRRYKACHGRPARTAAARFVPRPFEGLSSEGDWVALREFVPAGRAQLAMAARDAPPASIATLLPMIAPGAVTRDGERVLGLQTAVSSMDPSRDYAAALEGLGGVEPGELLDGSGAAGAGPRLQDLLDLDVPLQVEVLDNFDFWLEEFDDPGGLIATSVERANAAISPTVRLSSVDAAYWSRDGDRCFLRWALPEPEDSVVDALARLHVARADLLGEGTRQVGAFRAHGLLVAVWELPTAVDADAYEEPAATLADRYRDALAVSAPLSEAERSAKAGLLNRQRTIR
jgi:hypothetical protein